MKKSCSFFLFLGLSLGIVFGVSQKVFAQTEVPVTETASPLPQVTCEDAEKYMAEGKTELARAAYEAVKLSNPQAKCVIEGLFLLGTLTPTPSPSLTPSPSSTAIPSATPLTPNPYDVVEQLVLIGAHDAAATQLAVAVATNPSSTEVGQFTGEPWLVSLNIKRGIINYLPWLLALILVIVIIGWLKERRKLHLDISDFDLTTIDVKLDTAQGSDLNKAMNAEFEQSLYRILDTTPWLDPDVIDQPLSLPDLPAFTSMPKEAQDLWAFFTKLIPANVVTVKGNLEFEKVKGPGLSVKLIHNPTSDLLGSYTVWKVDIDPDFTPIDTKPKFDEYIELIEPVAIWSYWKVYGKRQPLREVFGTSNVDSMIATRCTTVALNRLSTIHDVEKRKCERQKVEKGYRRALISDPDNLVALLNLGILLKDGTELFNRIRKIARKSDQTFINASYTLGVIEIESYIKDEKKEHLSRAESYLFDALKGAKKAKRKNGSLFPDEFMLMIHIPLEDVRWWQRGDASPDPLKDILTAGYTAPRVLYNLACHLCMAVHLKKLDDRALDQALKLLEDAFLIEPDYVFYSEDDISLKSLAEKREKEFNKIKKKYKPVAKSTPVSGQKITSFMNLLGEETARRLGSAGVASEHDLLRLASKRQSRQVLAQKSKVSQDILLYWARVIELIRISGVDISTVALLEASGIVSLKKLKDWKQEELELLELLKSTNEQLKLDVKLPQREVLTWWLEQAEHTPTQVEPF